MMSGNSHTDKNSDVADVSVLPAREIIAVDETEEANPAATTQQKRVKAGLLAVLAVIVIYVVLDYTVSMYMLSSLVHSQNGLRSAAAAAAAAAAALTRLS